MNTLPALTTNAITPQMTPKYALDRDDVRVAKAQVMSISHQKSPTRHWTPTLVPGQSVGMSRLQNGAAGST